MGTKGIAVVGQMGINLQLVDVIYTCSEGWEGPELASSLHYACKRRLLGPAYYRNCMSKRVLWGK